MQDEDFQKRLKFAIFIFVIVSALTGFYCGATDMVLANYFKESYEATATQRGLIEIPRELPGIAAFIIITALSFLRDIRMAVIAQLFGIIGLVALGLFHPSFGVMMVFLFFFSLGQHMFMPLGDSIGLSLATRENMGRILGTFKSSAMAFAMVAGLVCFFGFRSGFFSFDTPVTILLICAGTFATCAVLLLVLRTRIGRDVESHTEVPKLVFRKEYARYYVLSAIFGARKQIMVAFSPWVLIELLGFKADMMSMLGVIGAFVGIFVIILIGKMVDKKGSRFAQLVESGLFVIVYIVYGLLSGWISDPTVVITSTGLFFVYVLFICDRMTAQFIMVRAIYLKSIAIKPDDVTPTLSAGLAIDHVCAITGAFLCGLVWDRWGAEFVFVIAAIISAANFIVAWGIKKDAVIDRTKGSKLRN